MLTYGWKYHVSKAEFLGKKRTEESAGPQRLPLEAMWGLGLIRNVVWGHESSPAHSHQICPSTCLQGVGEGADAPPAGFVGNTLHICL